jgi:hypothetical protein
MFASKDIFLKSSGGAYQISRSVRLRSSASAYLNRAFTTPTSQQKGTFSFWLKRGALGARNNLFSNDNGTQYGFLEFDANNLLNFSDPYSAGACNLITTQVFRDPSAWYHIIIAFDTTQATSTNRAKFYVNGVQITSFGTAIYPSQNANLYMLQAASAVQIAAFTRNGTPTFDGYLTEFNFIDGQALTPSSFGETNAITGVWQPKTYSGTYGTNGFYLNFSDNSNNTAATIGKDYSGNGNNWTPNNISVTSGVTYDSMLDVPTLYADGGNGRGNYATLNPLDKATSFTTAGGNLNFTPANTSDLYSCRSTIQIPSTGKWIWEVTNTNSTYMITAGLLSGSTPTTGQQTVTCAGMTVGSIGTFFSTTQWMNTTTTWSVTNIGNGDTLVIAYDADAGKIWFGRVASGGSTVTFYNTSGTADPSTGTDPRASGIVAGGWFAGFGTYFTPSGASANFGQRPFAFTNIPTGFVALNTQNLPTPTISNGAQYMAATTYTGTGAALTIANTVGSASFQPDLVWVKGRSGATDHALYDAVRGVQLQLESNTTTDQTTETTGLTAFGSTGFTVGALAQMNTSAATYVAWQWKEGATQGFDIVTYTGNGSARTISHNLGVAPNMIIVKARTTASTDQGWPVYHSANTAAPETDYLLLNSTAATADLDTVWNDTAPTSSVFSVGTNANVNANNDTYVAYCFAAVAGYSAFGSYTGNSSADGPFVYLGFRPRYLLIKSSVVAGGTWVVFDSARSTYNVTGEKLAPNTADSENSGATGIAGGVDFLSNGFKIRLSWGDINTSNTLIYAAFAENPFKNSLAR